MPQVSIIIPTRSRSHQIGAAIRSVIDQTFTDWELIVVDDASNDDTPGVIAGFTDRRITSRRHSEPRGGAAARNEGIRIAQSDYIAFLDDDDLWDPRKLEQQMQALTNSDAGLCYTAKAIVKNGRASRISWKTPRWPEDLHKSIMADNFIGTTSCMMTRKTVLDEIGTFDESLPALQDYDLCIRILRKWNAVGIQKPLVTCDLTDTGDHVSFDWRRTIPAARILLAKYGADPYYPLLRNGLMVIYLKKALKSRKFMTGILLSILTGAFFRHVPSHTK